MERVKTPRKLKTAEELREATRLRVQRHRERKTMAIGPQKALEQWNFNVSAAEEMIDQKIKESNAISLEIPVSVMPQGVNVEHVKSLEEKYLKSGWARFSVQNEVIRIWAIVPKVDKGATQEPHA